jgi:hypothetical protein
MWRLSWRAELAELFYDALLRDHRSEDYTAEEMRRIADRAAYWSVGRDR